MSQKAELPSLTGHRTKTRKRDEKKVRRTMTYVFSHYDYIEYLHEHLEIFEYFHEYLEYLGTLEHLQLQVYDPSGFRDSVIEGLEQSRDEEDLGDHEEMKDQQDDD